MATKSKSTKDISYFKGLVSWISTMLLMLTSCLIILSFIFMIVSSFTEVYLADIFPYLSYPDGTDLLDLLSDDAAFSTVALFTLAIVFTFCFRRHRKAFEAALAHLLGKIWVELKLLFILGGFAFTLIAYSDPLPAFIPVFTCACVFLLYFICLDISHNKRFFGHNILHSLLTRLNDYHGMTTFQQRSLRRIYSCVAVIAGVIAASIFIIIVTAGRPGILGNATPLGAVIFALMGTVGTIWWYVLALKRDLRDWNILMTQIAEMYDGNLDAVNHVPPNSNLYDCAMQLNMIRTGIQKTVDEGIKADRTKVELITNVSHDLKTPLTSIISYVELLKKEPDLPPHVMDYINTIAKKADRLSHMVQDVFDVSKAATGNISLDLEDLDVGRLLQQTFVEMEETLKTTQLTWRIEIPETPMTIHADGQRLYRVFQNLIRNCAQYSLEGSRAYVSLTANNGSALVCIRNVSRNEITMQSEELTARFVRGDQNRTTEGSGLGLSIAKSFTEACGGQFSIRTDGDLFTVTVQFPLVNQPQPTTPAVQDPAQH